MAYITTVLYPKEATFDMAYYLEKHMPMVDEHWRPMGLEGWAAIELKEGPYRAQTLLRWKDEASYTSGVNSEGGKALVEDIAKFSSEKPLIIHGTGKAKKD